MSKINRYFDFEVAKDVGVDCAIILHNIQFWCERNRLNDKNFFEDKYWTYNTLDAFVELFGWLSKKQIRNRLDTLENKGYLLSGNFNKVQFDRTKWYAPNTDKIRGISKCPNGHMEMPKQANGNAQMGTPIPDNKPNSNTNTNTPISSLEEEVESGNKKYFNIKDEDYHWIDNVQNISHLSIEQFQKAYLVKQNQCNLIKSIERHTRLERKHIIRLLWAFDIYVADYSSDPRDSMTYLEWRRYFRNTCNKKEYLDKLKKAFYDKKGDKKPSEKSGNPLDEY